MRVVVTGGAGYIGSVVTEVLVSEGHAVLLADNLSKGHRESVVPDAAFSEIDLLDQPVLTRTLREFAADAVMHLAAS